MNLRYESLISGPLRSKGNQLLGREIGKELVEVREPSYWGVGLSPVEMKGKKVGLGRKSLQRQYSL